MKGKLMRWWQNRLAARPAEVPYELIQAKARQRIVQARLRALKLRADVVGREEQADGNRTDAAYR